LVANAQFGPVQPGGSCSPAATFAGLLSYTLRLTIRLPAVK
jgi:hypothetical protein